jgi:hypothetical protein
MRWFLLVAVVTWASPAHGSDFPTVRFYDKNGRSVGTATTYSGGQTKVYDERGRLVGTAARRPK